MLHCSIAAHIWPGLDQGGLLEDSHSCTETLQYHDLPSSIEVCAVSWRYGLVSICFCLPIGFMWASAIERS